MSAPITNNSQNGSSSNALPADTRKWILCTHTHDPNAQSYNGFRVPLVLTVIKDAYTDETSAYFDLFAQVKSNPPKTTASTIANQEYRGWESAESFLALHNSTPKPILDFGAREGVGFKYVNSRDTLEYVWVEELGDGGGREMSQTQKLLYGAGTDGSKYYGQK